MEPQARELAAANCTAFGMTGAEADSVDAIIINAAGCGAMLKDYEHLMHGTDREEAAKQFVAKVERHQRVPGGARPDRSRRIRCRSRRPITTPATCGTPSKSPNRRGNCWR